MTPQAELRKASRFTVEAPASPEGLRRVITSRVPAPAYDRLRIEGPLLERAANALQTGLDLTDLTDPKKLKEEQELRPSWDRYAKRPLAIPVTATQHDGVRIYADEICDGDQREAAGILIARGLGARPQICSSAELPAKSRRAPTQVTAAPSRFVVRKSRPPEARGILPPNDSAPNCDELRNGRIALGISQRELAAASRLSNGLIAMVERGLRRHVLTRLRISETLARLAATNERGKKA